MVFQVPYRALPGTERANFVRTPLVIETESALMTLDGRNGIVCVEGAAGRQVPSTLRPPSCNARATGWI